jgi:beta-glucosidase
LAAARRADVVLAFVGEEAILSGEAHCLADLNLQGEQSDLLAGLKNTGKRVVTVVMAGRALTIGRDLENSNALLFSFHPGTMGGPALADLIFGAAVPSGKLPVTFPKTSGQIPLYYNHNMTGRPYQGNETSLKDIPLQAGQTSLGNTSFYLDAGADPLFPFGFGLSYTSFAYTNVQIDKVNYTKEDTITVSFDLSNTGAVTGTEVAQIYIRDMVGSVTRPVKELKGFTRISLNPGETRSITMKIPVIELAFWDLNMKKTVEPGAFRLWVAGDSVSGEPLTFEIK